MIHKHLNHILPILLLSASLSGFAQNSVLSSGAWVKAEVDQNTIVRLSYEDLAGAGLPVAGASPETLQVFGNGSGMLPQENDSAITIDPEELAIQVIVQQSGTFQPGDFILFYAEGPDYIKFNNEEGKIEYQNHLFSNQNYYFITVGQSAGKRILKEPEALPGTILSKGIQYKIHEEDLYNILHSGRNWYGEKFDLTTNQSFDVSMTNIAPGSEIKIFSSVLSSSTEVSSFTLTVNGQTVGTHNLPANPSGTYNRKGTPSEKWFSINQSLVGESLSSLNYQFTKSTGLGYLNYFIVQAERTLEYSGAPLHFFTGNYALLENRTVEVSNCPDNVMVLDVTNPLDPRELEVEVNSGTANFNINSTTRAIIVFSPDSTDPVSDLDSFENQDLKSTGQIELLIVSAPEFINLAKEIAALRGVQGIQATAVTAEEIYNEFSSGKKDITAIRNYTKYLFENAGLKHLMLFGKGTYDPKNILESGMEQLPIYQSRNSLDPLYTYASDDYLGFMEAHEGYWAENSDDDHTMDIGVGRVPVTSVAEAEIFLNKLKTYQSKAAIGNWRQKVVFVAENGDNNYHQRDAERLTTLIDTTYEAFTTNKIYIDAYPIEVKPGSMRAPQANKDLYDAINSGALIVNYTGHGNEDQWANTRIFDKKVIDTLLNTKSLPLFVTATCEFGRHDDTGRKSGSEELLLLKNTGAISAITTSRPVFASTNFMLNRAFYDAVFEKVNGSYRQLGEIFLETKNNSLNNTFNRNFSLLGDPSMKLSYGEQFITLDSLNDRAIESNDTLKALEEIRFTGSIRQANQTIDQSFDGIVDILLLDRSRTKQTLGNLGQNPFTYSVRDNVLFSGSSDVSGGQFNFSTVLPKDISYNPESARVVLYAYRSDSTIDAIGANIDLLIGGSSNSSIVDNTPPEIDVFIGDTLFRDGDIVNRNSLLIVKLFDENGINTSSSQVGHSITYQLDNMEPVVLNEFYSTEINDFRSGWIYYNLPQMSPGKHSIKVTAWDTSNNSNSEITEFSVMSNNQIVITNLSNYPNPMIDDTNFAFNHNLGGDDIEVRLEILSTSGQIVYSETRIYNSAVGTINDWHWDGRNNSGGKLLNGIYIYGVNVRSISNGAGEKQFSRLFISN